MKDYSEMTKNLPEPFMGRLLLENLHEDPMKYIRKQMGMENSLLQLPETHVEHKIVPLTKGRIIAMSPSAFGKYYKQKYGEDTEIASIGDIVSFVRNQDYKVDIEHKFSVIADEDIVLIERNTEE